MNNPEVQQIMGDPAMRMILEQMQTDPQVFAIEKSFLATKRSREENSSNCISGPTSDQTAADKGFDNCCTIENSGDLLKIGVGGLY